MPFGLGCFRDQTHDIAAILRLRYGDSCAFGNLQGFRRCGGSHPRVINNRQKKIIGLTTIQMQMHLVAMDDLLRLKPAFQFFIDGGNIFAL